MDRLRKIVDICNLYKQGKYTVEEFQSWLRTALLPEPETELGKILGPLIFDSIERLEEIRFSYYYGNGTNEQGIAIADELIRVMNESLKQARIVIISGPPGAGKSTVAHMLAENSTYERAVHIHTDDFYRYICKGYIEPWETGSGAQNTAVAKVMTACAAEFMESGYEVFIDGIVGPWLLEPWIQMARSGAIVHYAVLRPDMQETVARATARTGTDALVDAEVVKKMWADFSDLGEYESHVIDTACQTAEESAAVVRNLLSDGRLRVC